MESTTARSINNCRVKLKDFSVMTLVRYSQVMVPYTELMAKHRLF